MFYTLYTVDKEDERLRMADDREYKMSPEEREKARLARQEARHYQAMLRDTEIATAWLNGKNRAELKAIYNMSDIKLDKILNGPIAKKVMKEREKAINQLVKRVFAKHDRDFEQMLDKYFARALDDETIKKTGIGQLFTVIDVVSKRFEAIQRNELENRRLALENKRMLYENRAYREVLEADAEVVSGDNSIIGHFLEKMKGMATPNLDKSLQSADNTSQSFNNTSQLPNKSAEEVSLGKAFEGFGEDRSISVEDVRAIDGQLPALE